MEGAPCRMLAICYLLLSLGFSNTNGQTLEQQLETADQQLDFLTSRVASLTSKMGETLGDQVDADIQGKYLSWILDRQEGKTGACQKGLFPCGPGPDGGVQCIRSYLVCDGSVDCKNGADEADVCDRMPFTRPIRMDLYVLSDNCQFGLQDDAAVDFASEKAIKIVFDPADVNPWFPSRPKITWTGIATVHTSNSRQDTMFPNFGFYNYATEEINLDQFPMTGAYGDFFIERTAAGKLRMPSKVYRVFADTNCMTSAGIIKTENL